MSAGVRRRRLWNVPSRPPVMSAQRVAADVSLGVISRTSWNGQVAMTEPSSNAARERLKVHACQSRKDDASGRAGPSADVQLTQEKLVKLQLRVEMEKQNARRCGAAVSFLSSGEERAGLSCRGGEMPMKTARCPRIRSSGWHGHTSARVC